MMAQFLDIKQDYPDALLFYRMGDFYELFFDDAIAASGALDIALTKRGKHLGNDIPMCGVPFHAAENYLLTLIRKGFRVAVCEQLETPAQAKARGGKTVVKRGVVRLVTPGTLTEDSLLDSRHHNYLCALANVRGDHAMAWVDVSTGLFKVQKCPRISFGPMLARLAPQEVLLPEASELQFDEIIADIGAAPTRLAGSSFDSTSATQRLCKLFQVSSLDGFGQFDRAELAAMGAIVDYLEITQKGKLPLLQKPVQELSDTSMQIDAATRRNLEITRSLTGDKNGSLLSVIDKTVTGAGARLIESRINNPSTQVDLINDRLDAIQYFIENTEIKDKMRADLKAVSDLDRALSRLSLDRGGPRDLTAIRSGLVQAANIHSYLGNGPTLIEEQSQAFVIEQYLETLNLLKAAVIEEPPLLVRDGGFVASSFDTELDETRLLRDQGRGVISELQKEYAELVGISALKIKHNNVLGYFIETPATHAKTMLGEEFAEVFKHRQTTANAVRFTTTALSEMETKILNASGRAQEIELRIFETIRQTILETGEAISNVARALAELDLAAALADLAIGENWSRPQLSRDKSFKIKGGRHPVVEASLRRMGTGSFVANDIDLTPDTAKPVWLLTGPNMAGKSTFLRQNALIALLAQMGSFVPADTAEIGLVTQLFSRVGASDDLARGRSTFMVEMVETAAILNQAGDGALVILDEIGRGTATYDGLSIAWATLENLHDVNKCRTLFATHYHELTGLSSSMDGLHNATVSVREWEGEIIFLHEVISGAADRSYGVQVAKLAGLPDAVIERARTVLEALEKSDREGGGKTDQILGDLPLFSAPAAPMPTVRASAIDDRFNDIQPDSLSPREALDLIYELKSLSEK
jgi:DNA mismatch repair protein MutS